MERTLEWDSLRGLTPPWAHLVCCEEEEIDSAVFAICEDGFAYGDTVLRTIRAQHCTGWHETFVYWSAALQFPGYFGFGGDAFKDCMRDLGWLRATHYIIVVTKAYLLLSNEDEAALAAFLGLLKGVSEDWAKPVSMPNAEPEIRTHYERGGVPFHVLFQCEIERANETRYLYARQGTWLSPVAFISHSSKQQA